MKKFFSYIFSVSTIGVFFSSLVKNKNIRLKKHFTNITKSKTLRQSPFGKNEVSVFFKETTYLEVLSWFIISIICLILLILLIKFLLNLTKRMWNFFLKINSKRFYNKANYQQDYTIVSLKERISSPNTSSFMYYSLGNRVACYNYYPYYNSCFYSNYYFNTNYINNDFYQQNYYTDYFKGVNLYG